MEMPASMTPTMRFACLTRSPLYAAAGRFSGDTGCRSEPKERRRNPDATKTTEEAAMRADASAPNLAPDIRARLALYGAGKPLIEVRR